MRFVVRKLGVGFVMESGGYSPEVQEARIYNTRGGASGSIVQICKRENRYTIITTNKEDFEILLIEVKLI